LIRNAEKNEINLAAVITVTKDIYVGYNSDSKFVSQGYGQTICQLIAAGT